ADVKVGEVLAVIEEGAAAPAKPAPASEPAPVKSAAPAAAAPETEKKRATPAARNAAQQQSIDLAQVPGAGAAGRVMKRDVAAFGQSPSAATPAAAAPAP